MKTSGIKQTLMPRIHGYLQKACHGGGGGGTGLLDRESSDERGVAKGRAVEKDQPMLP